MMDIKEIAFNDDCSLNSAKGTFKKNIIFSKITDKVIYWAELGLDYCGG